jgi:hypothetical protein
MVSEAASWPVTGIPPVRRAGGHLSMHDFMGFASSTCAMWQPPGAVVDRVEMGSIESD